MWAYLKRTLETWRLAGIARRALAEIERVSREEESLEPVDYALIETKVGEDLDIWSQRKLVEELAAAQKLIVLGWLGQVWLVTSPLAGLGSQTSGIADFASALHERFGLSARCVFGRCLGRYQRTFRPHLSAGDIFIPDIPRMLTVLSDTPWGTATEIAPPN
jgi:hypothetical protein